MNNAKHLSDLVALANDAQSRAAMEEYLNGEDHDKFYLASALTGPCEKGTDELRKGHLAPHLDIAPDADAFAGILTTPAHVEYDGCELIECNPDDPDEAFDHNPEIPDRQYERLAKLPPDELLERLTEGCEEDGEEDGDDAVSGCCSPVRFTRRHAGDAKAQRDYYDAVLDRFSAAAECAMKLGAEATARKWLEAERLLQPGGNFSRRGIRDWRGLCLVPECVARAYRVAEEAHAMLWVDERYRVRSAAAQEVR